MRLQNDVLLVTKVHLFKICLYDIENIDFEAVTTLHKNSMIFQGHIWEEKNSYI